MEVIFLEIVDEEGELRQRVRVDRLPFGIGRDLENDLVLDDPYVCPRHLELRREQDGSIHAYDLKSLNGLVDEGAGEKVPAMAAAADRVMRIGHTRFRLRRASDPLPPTLRDESGGVWSFDPFRGPWARLMQILAGVAVISVNRFLGVWTRVAVDKSILPEILEYLLGLLVYSLVWFLIGFVLIRRWRFSHHTAIFSCSLFLAGIVDVITNFVMFNVPSSAPVLQSVTPPMILICLAVFWHLGYASRMTRRRRLLVALGIYGIAAGLNFAKSRKSEHDFRAQPTIDEPLMPPGFLVAPRLEVGDLGPRMEALRERVDAQAARKKAYQHREKK